MSCPVGLKRGVFRVTSQWTRYQRRLARMHGYDYALTGAYFVTACARNRQCMLGEVAGGDIIQNS